MEFTVLLLRPDYAADNFGQDTYMAHVTAPSVDAAVEKAREEVCLADNDDNDEDPLSNRQDYAVICVLQGHLKDLYTGY